MKISVLTLFPEVFEMYLSQTILQRAIELGKMEYDIVNIRDYARNKHNQMDDIPFGGGAGMVLKPEAYWNYFQENFEFYGKENLNEEDLDRENIKSENVKFGKLHVIFVTPQGKTLNHQKVMELAKKEELVIISGRYEGLDERVIEKFVDEEISIGDYVLSSGDLPSLVLLDSISRIKEGVIKKESFETDSFYNGLLGFPQYTRPVEIDGYEVPEVLRSGNHAKIDEFRYKKAIEKTIKNRKDLFEKKILEDEKFKKEYEKLFHGKSK